MYFEGFHAFTPKSTDLVYGDKSDIQGWKNKGGIYILMHDYSVFKNRCHPHKLGKIYHILIFHHYLNKKIPKKMGEEVHILGECKYLCQGYGCLASCGVIRVMPMWLRRGYGCPVGSKTTLWKIDKNALRNIKAPHPNKLYNFSFNLKMGICFKELISFSCPTF